MVPKDGIAAQLAEFADPSSGNIEELRRQLATAREGATAAEVGQRHEAVLSNIMMPGEKSAQIGVERPEGTAAAAASAEAADAPRMPLPEAERHMAPPAVHPQDAAEAGPIAQPQPAAAARGSSSPIPVWSPESDRTPAPQAAGQPPQAERDAPRAAAQPANTAAGPDAPQPAEGNHAPVAGAIADQTATEDAGFSFGIPEDAFSDADAGDALSYTATLADGSALPSWLHFDAATQTFSGTPENGDVGDLAIRVTATDSSGAWASVDFHVTVQNTNDGPVVSAAIADQTATEDSGFTFTVPGGAFTDVDAGDVLTFTATLADGSPLPSWLHFDAATQTFSGTPENGDVGDLSIRVTATDRAGASASQDVHVSVQNTNDGPVVSAAIADQTATEDSGFSFSVPNGAFTDVDAGDVLTFTATLADGSPLPSWLHFDAATQTFSGTPENGDVGDLSIRVTATDRAGASASQDVHVSVQNTNDGPVVSAAIADQTATEDSGFSFSVPNGAFTDVDAGDVLTFTATLADGSALPSWLHFDAATQTFSGTPENGDVGDLAIRVTATDSSGAWASVDFHVTVQNTNDGPVVSAAIADQTATEDSGFTFTVPGGAFTDVDAGDVLTFTATLADGSALPSWLHFDAATQTFSGTPENGDVGDLSIRVTATDSSGAWASVDFHVTVQNTNDGPVVSAAIADQTATEDSGFTFTVPGGAFTDVDAGDVLTFTATLADGSALPSWLHFDAATQTFSGTPENGDVGDLAIRVTATDRAGASASQDVHVTVQNTNDGPVVSAAIADQTATEDSGFSFSVPNGAFTDVDAGDVLTFTATLADGSPLPSWLHFDAATQTFSGTPENGDVGDLSIRVTATDRAGASASQDVHVSVQNTNDGPVVSAAIADQTATEDSGFTFTVPGGAFTDVDAGDVLTFTATLADGSALPSWLHFDAATQTFSGTPENGDVGDLAIRVTATDRAGASASQDVHVSVQNTNDGPVVSAAIADQTATEDSGFSFSVPNGAFTDVDAGDVLTFTATLADGSPLPSWLHFDAATQTFSGTPENGDVGDLAIRVTATDKAGASASQDVHVSVQNTNDGPVITSAATAVAAENATGTVYTATATDADAGSTITYSLSGDDAARFNIDARTGAVSFKSAPDYEAPSDAGRDNVYNVTVQASDGLVTTTKDVSIAVANVNEGPTGLKVDGSLSVRETVTSGGDIGQAYDPGAEQPVVATLAGLDPDAGETLTYTLVGGATDLFAIKGDRIVVAAGASFDHESAASHDLTVRVTDSAGHSYDRTITVAVEDYAGDYRSKDEGVSVQGTSEEDRIVTGAGNDTVAGGAGADAMSGGEGRDTLDYSASPEGVYVSLADGKADGGDATGDSFEGFENVTGSRGDDKLIGDKGDNVLAGGAGADYLDGGDGTDTLDYSGSEGGVYVNLGDGKADGGDATGDSFEGFENVTGSRGDDKLIGDKGDNVLAGGAGADYLDGGDGTDTADYSASGVGVYVDLGSGKADGGDATGDVLANVENVTGSGQDDVFVGSDADNVIAGGAGADTLVLGGNFQDYGITYDKETDSYTVVDLRKGSPDGTDTVSQVERFSFADGTIEVKDPSDLVNHAPVFTSGPDASFAENGKGVVYTATATDSDPGSSISYSISGADAALFDIDATTGAVTFKASPNFEKPLDAGGDNVYDIVVSASDGRSTTNQAVGITVTNVNEAATAITASGPPAVTETVTSGGSIGTAYDPGTARPVVATLSTNDPEGPSGTSYALVGGGGGLFTISGNEIRVAAGASFDYETTPSYNLTVRATDAAGNTIDRTVTVKVSNYAGSYTGTAGDDTAVGTSEEDTISGGAGNDRLSGGAGNDVLDGGDGNDTLIGGAGADKFVGGAGTDTVDYSGATAGVGIAFAAMDGSGIGSSYGNIGAGGFLGEAASDSFSGIETFIGTSFADTIGGGATDMTFFLGGGNDVFDTNAAYNVVDVVYGGDGNDTIWTGAGNDILIGGAGNDYLNGEAGTDTASYVDATSGVTVNLGTTSAQNTGGAGTDTLIDIENLQGSGFADTLTGNGGANAIWGGAGNDTISGGAGNDTIDAGDGDDTVNGGSGDDVMSGGAGTDWLSYADAGSVTVNLNLKTAQNTGYGTDTISGFENLLGGNGNDTLTGDAGANIILGGSGNDIIDAGDGNDTLGGGDGNDTLTGGAGIDTATYADAGKAVTVNLATTGVQNTGGAGNDTLSGIENLIGSAYADTLTGDANANSIWGGAGNDTIDGGNGNDLISGGSGADTLTGGAGTDTLDYSSSTGGVTVNLATNTASGGDAQGDVISGFENVTGGTGNDVLTAASAGSVLDGGAGDDVLHGGNGNDVITGGDGNDTVYASNGIDKLDGGAGSDTIDYSIGTQNMTVDLSKGLGYYTSYPAGADSFSNFENAVGGSADDTMIGSSLDNVLSGGAGNDSFFGGAGNDTLIGGAGADLFMIQAGLGNDTVVGGAGGGWVDAIDLRDAAGNSYSGAMPTDWTLVLTSGSIVSTSGETMTLSEDSSGYILHSDGTQVDFSQIEQIRW